MSSEYKDKIVVSFPGGAYGSYLLWLLYTLTSDEEIIAPFGDNGNSHNAKKIANRTAQRWITLTQMQVATLDQTTIPDSCYLVKNHPKINEHDQTRQTIDKLLDAFKKVIFLYPSKSDYLLSIHNHFFKVLQEKPFESALSNINLEDLYNNYPDAQGISPNDLPVWILREYLSLNTFTSWEKQVEWYFPDRCNDRNICVILVKDLLYDVENTLDKIKDFYSLTWKRNVKDVFPYHKQNLSQQMHLNQDSLCNTILENFFNNNHFSWNADELSVISEAYLQKKLRDNHYELKCHGLDVFPTSITQLKEIIA